MARKVYLEVVVKVVLNLDNDMMVSKAMEEINYNFNSNSSRYEVSFSIPEATIIKPYEHIWKAVCKVESNGNANAYNHKEKATGIVQIRPIKLKDYNQRTHSNYKLADCNKVDVSKKIFMYYAQKFNPNDHKRIAKDWNKSKTDRYWDKIKKHI